MLPVIVGASAPSLRVMRGMSALVVGDCCRVLNIFKVALA